MKQPTKQTKIATQETISTSLDADDIVALIREVMPDCFDKGGKFTISVTVPSGGDYSGTKLIIGEDIEIDVVQTIEATKCE